VDDEQLAQPLREPVVVDGDEAADRDEVILLEEKTAPSLRSVIRLMISGSVRSA